jgi:hypothetical protein
LVWAKWHCPFHRTKSAKHQEYPMIPINAFYN